MKCMIVNRYHYVVAVGSRLGARVEAMSPCVIKWFEIPAFGSRSDASDAFFCDLFSTVITLEINGGD